MRRSKRAEELEQKFIQGLIDRKEAIWEEELNDWKNPPEGVNYVVWREKNGKLGACKIRTNG